MYDIKLDVPITQDDLFDEPPYTDEEEFEESDISEGSYAEFSLNIDCNTSSSGTSSDSDEVDYIIDASVSSISSLEYETCLLLSFQYLGVYDLLQASSVSHKWKGIASHYTLWETVRMKNLRVTDWIGFADSLQQNGTTTLDLRDMRFPNTQEEISEMWVSFGNIIYMADSLRTIDMGTCPTDAIEAVASSCPQLISLTSLAITGNDLDFKPFSNCPDLTELKLNSITETEIKNAHGLKDLKSLKFLSLTNFKSIQSLETFEFETLKTLGLGKCDTVSEKLALSFLSNLEQLYKLRLESLVGLCPIVSILNTISTLPNLYRLELIDIDILPGFETAIAKCTNVKALIISACFSESSVSNELLIEGFRKMQMSLITLVWGKASGNQGFGCKNSKELTEPNKDEFDISQSDVISISQLVKENSKAILVKTDPVVAVPNIYEQLPTLLPFTKVRIFHGPIPHELDLF